MTPFPKDILIIDFEASAVDLSVSEPIQIGAILLDKNTLAEKDSFTSFIHSELKNADPESLAVSGVKPEDLVNAPTQAEVGKLFYEKFGTAVFLASWIEHFDRRMLYKILAAANLNYRDYDYHFLDIWPAAYVHLLKQGYTGGVHSEEMFQALGLPKRGTHDALEDCRHAAEALRKIMM